MTCLRSIFVLLAATTLASCSNSTSEPSPSGTGGGAGGGSPPAGSGGSSTGNGGTTGSGGNVGSGGTTVTSSGGAPGSGGQGGSTLGGAGGSGGPATGGQAGGPKTGGASGSGGGAGAGTGGSGPRPTGGTTGSGGASSGTTGSGGGSGTVGGGGVTSAGGTKGTGGGNPTGGTTGGGGSTGTAGSTGAQHWVGTWTGSPYYDSGNQPPTSLSNAVLRQIAHVSLGGSQIRVQLANCGNGSVTINSAHIARSKSDTTADSNIDTATDKALAFSGTASVTIAQGKEVWSDPIDFAVPNQGNITITTAFGSVPSNVCGHSGARTASYIKSGSSDVSAASMTSATTTEHWYYISGIDVMADASAKAVVAIGDSITDGRGTDTNKNNRWTDIMAARLQANAATAHVATMNQGIGATNLVGSSGTAAQARFNRDVLGQSGVKYVIVFDGVNDIGGGASYSSLKSAYDDLISRGHAKGLLIYGATILPFGGNSYYSTSHESVRQQVNTYIKSGVFDGVIDFDAALTDGGNPPKLKTEYATWAQTDGLHPGPAGYQKMGETVDLALFTK
jgi:lysophospholipase L1-like esterase